MHLANPSKSACTYIHVVFFRMWLQEQQLVNGSQILLYYPLATCILYTVDGFFPSFSPFTLLPPPPPPLHSCLLSSIYLFSLSISLLLPFPGLPFSLRTIYEKLGGAVSEEQRILYTQRVEEISPNVRYCAYNMGDTQTDITQIMKLAGDAPGYDMLASKIDVRIEHQCISHHPWSYPSCSF